MYIINTLRALLKDPGETIHAGCISTQTVVRHLVVTIQNAGDWKCKGPHRGNTMEIYISYFNIVFS